MRGAGTVKKAVSAIILICIMFATFPAQAADGNEGGIFEYIKSQGYDESYVRNDSGSYTVKISFDQAGYGMPDVFMDVAKHIARTDESLKNISFFAYLNDQAYLKIYTDGANAVGFAKGLVAEEEFVSNLSFADLRPVEEIIYTDLSIFEADIQDVGIYGKTLYVDLSYYGDDEEALLSDYIDMAFLGYENSPWVEKAVFTYESGDGGEFLQLGVKTEDLVQYYSDDTSPKELFSKIEAVTISKGGFKYFTHSIKRAAIYLYHERPIALLIVCAVIILVPVLIIVSVKLGRKRRKAA